MKNNLSYYRHDVNSHNHWKFKTLRRKYKWCGEGKFWALNNMIGNSENCRLDITDIDKKASIAADLDFDICEFDQYIDYLSNTCKLVNNENGILTTETTQENLSEVNDKRERQRNWKKQKSTHIISESTLKTGKSTSTEDGKVFEKEQSKVNESKVEEKKVNTAVSPALPDGLPKKRVSRKKEESEPYWASLVKTYFSFCYEKFNEKPSFRGADPSDMHRIIEVLKKRAAEKNIEWTEEVANLRWREFLGRAFQDDWLSKNWLLSNLNRKMDKVFFNLISSRNGTHQQQIAEVGKTIEFD